MAQSFSIKRVPKWAWIAGGGAAAGILYFRHRQASQAAGTPQAATPPADQGQTGQSYTAGYVDTPYSAAAPADNSQPVDLPSLIDSLGGFIAAAQPQSSGQQDTVASTVAALAPFIGGGAPSSSATSAGPATAAAAPRPVAPSSGGSSTPSCPSSFPLRGPHGCYHESCASGKGTKAKGMWHDYQSGLQLHVSSTC